MSAYPNAPVNRNVETSVAAAIEFTPKLGRLRRTAVVAIRDAGADGFTAHELAAHLNLDRSTIQPRISELRRKGHVQDSGQRRSNRSGKLAIAWVAV